MAGAGAAAAAAAAADGGAAARWVTEMGWLKAEARTGVGWGRGA